MQTLIQSVLTLQNGTLESVDVLLMGDRIHTVAPAATLPVAPHQRVIAGQDKLLLPGFVNGHTHSSQVWQRGLIPQLPLELWLANVFDSTPQQLEQSKVSKFRPDVALQVGAATVNPSYEVHQVRWSRQAMGKISEHVRLAKRWLEDNPEWHPDLVNAAPNPRPGARLGHGRGPGLGWKWAPSAAHQGGVRGLIRYEAFL